MKAHEAEIRNVPRTPCAPGTAVVVRCDEEQGCYALDEGHGVRHAARAVSCLVRPAVGDTVSWVAAGDGAVYLTAVLRREGSGPLRVSLPAGTVIESADGTLELRADVLALHSRALSIQGEQAHVSVEQIHAVGARVSGSFGVVKLTAELMESFAERVWQFSRWSQRVIDGPDQLRSRQMDYRAEQTLQLQAQAVIVNADKLLKADSDQIHLG